MPEKEHMDIINQTKEFLSDSKFRIQLHDLVAKEIRQTISLTTMDYFPVESQWSPEEFIERIEKYEKATSSLCSIQALLSYWASEAHRLILALPVKRICAPLQPESGATVWLALRWYPALLLLYAGGISAVAAGRYDNLKVLMQETVSYPRGVTNGRLTLIRGVFTALSEINDYRAFKLIPGHERNYAARSEYLFKLFQSILDDLLLLGGDYESFFDNFEVLLALEHAEQYEREKGGRAWGPVGRFGWKYRRRGPSSPLHRVISDADSQGESWPPIRAGLFKGSYDRFKEIAAKYSQLVGRLGWS